MVSRFIFHKVRGLTLPSDYLLLIYKIKGLAKLANIAWQTLFVSESLAMDKKVTPNLTQKQ